MNKLQAEPTEHKRAYSTEAVHASESEPSASAIEKNDRTSVADDADALDGLLPHPGPDALTRQAQRKRLDRAHKHHKPALKGERYGPLGGGTWVRPGAKRVRTDLEGWRLVDAVEWMATRRFRPWSSHDDLLITELSVRSFMYGDLERRIVHSRASWLDGLTRELWDDYKAGHEGCAGFPRSSGFCQFIADLVQARRSHAVGLFISQTDAETLYNVRDRTFRRWIKVAEAAKLVRVIQTWTDDRFRSSHHRCWGKTLYMLGPAIIERARFALLEGLDLQLPNGQPMKALAQVHARSLRRERRRRMRQAHDDTWQANNITARSRRTARAARPRESFKGPDIVSRSPPKRRETGRDSGPASYSRKNYQPPTSSYLEGSDPQGIQEKKERPAAAAWAAPSAPQLDVPVASVQLTAGSPPNEVLFQEIPGPSRPQRPARLADARLDELQSRPIGELLAERMRDGWRNLISIFLLVSTVLCGCLNSGIPSQTNGSFSQTQAPSSVSSNARGTRRSHFEPHVFDRPMAKRPSSGMGMGRSYSGTVTGANSTVEPMTEIPPAMLGRLDLSHSVIRLMTGLYTFCPWSQAHDPFVYPTLEQIRQRTGMSVPAIYRAITVARGKGLLTREKRGRLGFKLQPHPQAKSAQSLELNLMAPIAQPHKWEENLSQVGGKPLTSETPSHAAPSPKILTSETPYNIGTSIKKGGPPVPLENPGVEDAGVKVATLPLPDPVGALPPVSRLLATKPSPRAKAQAKLLADIELVFQALCEARKRLAERHKLKLTTIKKISREDFIKEAIGRHGFAQVLEAFRNQGELGGPKALGILTNAESPFRSRNLKRALDRDELKRLADFDVPDGERIIRETVPVKGILSP